MNNKLEKAKRFKILNEMALKGQKVVFGSSYMCNFPFYEIIQKGITDYVIYNRSIEDLTIAEAIETCEDCLKDLSPNNIIVSFGENEEINDKFYRDCKTLLLKLRNLYKNSKIAFVNTLDNILADKKLSIIAQENDITYIKVEQNDENEIFNGLSSFFRNGKISFYDAISVNV